MSEAISAIQQEIREHLREGRLPCAEAFSIARRHNVRPAGVATQAEEIGVRIGWCQLGLFTGPKNAQEDHPEEQQEQRQEVPTTLQERIEAALEQGALPCARAWGIAKRMGLERIQVGRAADLLGVRISRCQLNCFD